MSKKKLPDIEVIPKRSEKLDRIEGILKKNNLVKIRIGVWFYDPIKKVYEVIPSETVTFIARTLPRVASLGDSIRRLLGEESR